MTNAIGIVHYSIKNAKDTAVIYDTETVFRYAYLEKAIYECFFKIYHRYLKTIKNNT